MGIYATRLMRFCTTYVEALVGAPRYMYKEVGVRLLMWRQAAVAFHIRHCATDYKSTPLRHLDELLESIVVTDAMGKVDLVGHRIQGIQSVYADTALKTGASLVGPACVASCSAAPRLRPIRRYAESG